MSETSGAARQLTFRRLNRLCGDEELARRVSGGDSAAFDEVFRRYHQPIYRFCSAMVGIEEAKDVLQNVMTKVVTSMPDDKDFQMKPWLYRVARNECIDQIRSAGRTGYGLEADVLADHSGSREPQRVAETREQLNQLVKDLNDLPDSQRAVLVMRELSGLKYSEIAGSVGTSEAGAKQMVYEARLALEQMDLGRKLDCAEVRQTISGGDRRRLRGRRVSSHLKICTECSDFKRSIGAREAGFRSLYPALPLGMVIGVLGAIRDGGSAVGGVGGAATGSAAGGIVSTGVVSKGILAVVVAGGIGVGTARVVEHREPAGFVPGPGRQSRTLPKSPAFTQGFMRASLESGTPKTRPLAVRMNRNGKSAIRGSRPVGRTSAASVLIRPKGGISDSIDAPHPAPRQGNPTGSSTRPASSDAGQVRAAEASNTKPGQTGEPPPSRKPPAPPGQTTRTTGKPVTGPAADSQGAGGEPGVAKAVNKPESPGKSTDRSLPPGG